MKIELKEISIRDLTRGYLDEGEGGSITGFSGLLNIRPAYQREFVYDDEKRNAVIQSIRKGFPLNVMYWAIDEKVNYELLDGQQRTISICRYVDGDYSVDNQYFHNLTTYEKGQILDYKLMVYICEGTDKEKLDWFKIINIAGLELKPQELRNAIYTGPWLTDAKRYFSRNMCTALQVSKGYWKADALRQGYLETALLWICDAQGIKDIEEYMGRHQKDVDATELKEYWEAVFTWVQNVFPKPLKNEMEGIKWGLLYNKYHNNTYDKTDIENRVKDLQKNKEVTNKKGVFEYILDGDERHLSLRTFDDDDKIEVYRLQGGICPICKAKGRSKIDSTHDASDAHWELKDMEADHIIPWSKGGKTEISNCQLLCKLHNGMKSDK